MQTLITTPVMARSSLAETATRTAVQSILSSQLSGILGTSYMDIPLCSQMAFAASDDLRTLVVVTPRQGAKYDNLSANPNVSFLMSTAANHPDDSSRAETLTAAALASEAHGERRHKAVNLFAARHPHLLGFAVSPEAAVFELAVGSYSLVSNFQQTTLVSMD